MSLLSRRAFLLMSAMLPCIARAAFRNTLETRHPGSHLPWTSVVGSVIGPYDSVVQVGRIYQIERKRDGCSSSWIKCFIDDLGVCARQPVCGDLEVLRARYQSQVKRDFSAGRICLVAGYVLSRTECEVYQAVAERVAIPGGVRPE